MKRPFPHLCDVRSFFLPRGRERGREDRRRARFDLTRGQSRWKVGRPETVTDVFPRFPPVSAQHRKLVSRNWISEIRDRWYILNRPTLLHKYCKDPTTKLGDPVSSDSQGLDKQQQFLHNSHCAGRHVYVHICFSLTGEFAFEKRCYKSKQPGGLIAMRPVAKFGRVSRAQRDATHYLVGLNKFLSRSPSLSAPHRSQRTDRKFYRVLRRRICIYGGTSE